MWRKLWTNFWYIMCPLDTIEFMFVVQKNSNKRADLADKFDGIVC